MRHPESVAQLLSTVPEGGEEWQFWSAIAKLVGALDPPRTPLYGFACMYVFELADIRLKGGGGIGETVSDGGIENLARIIAVLFANSNADPIWWKSTYPTEMSRREVRQTASELSQRIPNLDIVERYVPWF